MSEKVRVVLADDHPIVLAGLRSLIQSENGFELVGEAATGLAALALVREKQPDVAVIDISMPQLNGIALAKRFAQECPSVRIVILTLYEDRAYFNQARQAGVGGYVLKRSAAENLVEAIRAVYLGGLYVDPAIASRFSKSDGRGSNRIANQEAAAVLTDREMEVLKFTAFGQTNKEIAQSFGVSVKSIETFKSRGIAKIGLKTRADIVRYASAQGWLADV